MKKINYILFLLFVLILSIYSFIPQQKVKNKKSELSKMDTIKKDTFILKKDTFFIYQKSLIQEIKSQTIKLDSINVSKSKK